MQTVTASKGEPGEIGLGLPRVDEIDVSGGKRRRQNTIKI